MELAAGPEKTELGMAVHSWGGRHSQGCGWFKQSDSLEAWFVCQETVAPNRWLGDEVNKCQALLPAALLFRALQSHVLSTSALDSGELRNAFLFPPGPLAGLPISRSRTCSVTCLSVTASLEAACQEPHFIAPLTLFNFKPNMWVPINVKTNRVLGALEILAEQPEFQ